MVEMQDKTVGVEGGGGGTFQVYLQGVSLKKRGDILTSIGTPLWEHLY